MFAAVLLPALWQADLDADLRAILADPALARASVAVCVKELGGGNIFEFNADKRLIPGSVQKLVTAALAFERLGPDFRPVTMAWRDGRTVKLLGGGDPGLTVAELVSLAGALEVKPHDRAVFDDNLFGDERYAPGWEVGDVPYAFCSPVSALTVNRGLAELWAAPGKAWLKPRNFGIAVAGVPKAGPGEPRLRRRIDAWTLHLSGFLPKGSGAKMVATVSLPDPALCAARVFHPEAERVHGLTAPVLLRGCGKNFSEQIHPHPALPLQGGGGVAGLPFGPRLAAISPRTVAELVRVMLQESDNHYAESLLRLCGARTGSSGSWEDSLALASQMLAKLQVPEDAFRLSDGSGLSRMNELTARSIVLLLESVLLTASGESFLSALAAPGFGTLKDRLKGLKVRAKTGTLTGVCCLAGIIEQAEPALRPTGDVFHPHPALPLQRGRGDPESRPGAANRKLIFAILMNHYPGKAKRPRELQDAIVARLSRPLPEGEGVSMAD